ncbi:MAG: RluA family pseudouridine synthase [Minwuia sp.]|uniref:RluA family pseudouridine synthase n=1 Tax=Minwuia sp. TaxID=2493630 RepID=UPI003A83EEF9
MLEATVEDADAGERLDRFLSRSFGDLSRSRLKALIGQGKVQAAGRTILDPSYRVKPGETLSVRVPPAEPAEPVAQDIALEILFEDPHLIVVNKPAGLVVHPAAGNPDGTLVNALIAHCGESLSGIGGVKRPGIVHRLDKDTSGVMVAAKTDAAHQGLSELFQRHDIERMYLALVRGVPSHPKSTVEGPIGRDPKNRKRMTVREGGKPAVTHYRVAERAGDAAALVECTLETGRTHQIRVHMAHIGHPVIGDPLYGRLRGGSLKGLDEAARQAARAFPRQALHAAVLGFIHPVTGEDLSFRAQLPQDMSELIRTLLRSVK